RLMGRRVRRTDIEGIIEKLRNRNPDLALRSTLISGFPGETEQEHQELLEFLTQVRFHRLGVFAFSREENTPAYRLSNQVPDHIKQERLSELTDLQNEISLEMNRDLMGEVRDVIFDSGDRESGAFTGRTSWDCPEIDNSVMVEDSVTPGRFYRVRITGCSDYDLSGVLAS
ncbi:MAG TPA: 30S ribosomal protein S12 methylthiotransferase RimO, partial [bacterium]